MAWTGTARWCATTGALGLVPCQACAMPSCAGQSTLNLKRQGRGRWEPRGAAAYPLAACAQQPDRPRLMGECRGQRRPPHLCTPGHFPYGAIRPAAPRQMPTNHLRPHSPETTVPTPPARPSTHQEPHRTGPPHPWTTHPPTLQPTHLPSTPSCRHQGLGSGAWQALASMNVARGSLAAAVACGRLYVFGGGKPKEQYNVSEWWVVPLVLLVLVEGVGQTQGAGERFAVVGGACC